MPDDASSTQVAQPEADGAGRRPRWFERHDILGGISAAIVVLCAAVVWWMDRDPGLAPQGRWIGVVAEERKQADILAMRERLLTSQAAGNVCEVDRPPPPPPRPPPMATSDAWRNRALAATVIVLVYPRPSPGLRRLAHHQLDVLVGPDLVLTDPGLTDLRRPDLADPGRVEIYVTSAALDGSSRAAIVSDPGMDRAGRTSMLLRLERPVPRMPSFLKLGPMPRPATEYSIAIYPHGRNLSPPFPTRLNEHRHAENLPPPEVVRETLVNDNFVLLSRAVRDMAPADSGAPVVDACGRLVGMVMRRPLNISPPPFPASNVVVPVLPLHRILASNGAPMSVDDTHPVPPSGGAERTASVFGAVDPDAIGLSAVCVPIDMTKRGQVSRDPDDGRDEHSKTPGVWLRGWCSSGEDFSGCGNALHL